MNREQDVATVAKTPTAGLWAVGILMVLVYYPTAGWLAHRWSLGVWFHTHGWAVPPIVAWLIHGGLKRTRGLPRDASGWGFLFLVPAVLLQVLDAVWRFELFSAVSLILAVPGLSLLLLGRQRTKAIWFGLFFLVFAVPIPLLVVTEIHLVLRQIAAVGTEWMLLLMAYPVEREGTLLQIGPEAIQIADACSGFATLMALSMAGLLMIYVARGSMMRRVAVAALIFPIAAIANVIRCVALCMLVLAFGGQILETWVHPFSGVVTFLIALFMLQGAMALLMPQKKKAEPVQ
jgi:exosortase